MQVITFFSAFFFWSHAAAGFKPNTSELAVEHPAIMLLLLVYKLLFPSWKCTKTCDWLDKIITSHFKDISLCQVFYCCAAVINQWKQYTLFFTQTSDQKQARQKSQLFMQDNTFFSAFFSWNHAAAVFKPNTSELAVEHPAIMLLLLAYKLLFPSRKFTKTCVWLEIITTPHFRDISMCQAFYHCTVVISRWKQFTLFFNSNLFQKEGQKWQLFMQVITFSSNYFSLIWAAARFKLSISE